MKRWTEEEEKYLLYLSDERNDEGEKFPPTIITIIFNDHFRRTHDYEPRTHGAVQGKLRELLKIRDARKKASGITVKQKKPKASIETKAGIEIEKKEKVKKMEKRKRKTNTRGPEKNSGMGWTPADDSYLVKNFTAHAEDREKVAVKLGRSVKACSGRLARLRNAGRIGRYMPEIARQNQVIDHKHEIVVDKQDDMMPITFFGFMTLWWRNRRRNKRAIKRLKLQRRLERLSK
tara:strand:+ start:915 stop:1613 length:699 start_codon:yes stop_codon:yes gene_type:complete